MEEAEDEKTVEARSSRNTIFGVNNTVSPRPC